MIATNDLVKKVRRLINESDDDVTISLITDDLRSIDDTILELMPQAVAIVQKQSRGRYVNAKTLLSDGVNLVESIDGFKAVVLPSDYANLVSVRMKSWKMPCFEVSLPDSADVLYKFNKKSSAVSLRPVCVEDFASDGVKILKLFPASNSDKLDYFVYEANFNVAEGLNLCDSRMVDAVLYVCVALLYNVFERYDAAKSFMTFATALCGDDTK